MFDMVLCRCNGEYGLYVLQAGQKPHEIRVDAKPFHKRFGYFKGMGGDEVGYATQSASKAIIMADGGSQIFCDILRENNFHTEERLYIAFSEESLNILSKCFHLTKSPLNPKEDVAVQFELKFSYFRSLKDAVRNLDKHTIERILPQPEQFEPSQPVSETRLTRYERFCSSDQLRALKVIASCPASGPPVLISGPFGTGKTRVLAIAAHYFIDQSIEEGRQSLRILVCTQQHTSADAYLEMFNNLASKKKDVTIIRLIPEHTWRNPSLRQFYRSVKDFKRGIERNSFRNRQRFLLVTTCLTAPQISDVLPKSFFTHIFLDEGAQMREPEAVAPLCLAGKATKIVIAGDKYQVMSHPTKTSHVTT